MGAISTLRSFVAIGDSFTEGLADPYPNGAFRGWADRVAEALAAHGDGFTYANLAVRGKLLRQIIADQVPRAIELAPDLVTFCAGGNDIIRPGVDPDALAEMYEDATWKLRESGAHVVIFTSMDPRDVPVLRRLRGKAATYNLHLRSIADKHGCQLIDLWSMSVLRARPAWCEDRLHLSPAGHYRVALRVCEDLGIPVSEDWREPWPPAPPPPPWLGKRREDLRWARAYFAPWVHRRLRGRSSGDGLDPKRPDLLPL